ncbi:MULTISPECIES: hypothetical protein [Eubacteriales]|uniref:hypothetical protein n=1 Tax=Eubacteriales TaxID=186802 RepID=UPI00085CDC1B|nr:MULTISPECIES: hypothetical protein [Eubacteriales]
MIRIVKESVDVTVSLEKAKREILAIRRQLVQDGKVSNHLGISFTVVDDTLATMIEELKTFKL